MGRIPYLNEELSYVLFLTEYNQKQYVVGAYQGRCIERGGYLYQQASKGAQLRGYTPTKIDEFLKMMERIVQ